MPWRKKVKQMIYNGKTASYTAGDVGDKNKKDQDNYEKKVKALLECCKQFERSLKNIESTKEFTSGSIESRFKDNFKDFLKKMFSKTSRVLNNMDKKLKKLGDKPIVIKVTKDKKTVNEVDGKLVGNIIKAFKYDAPKGGWEKDTIDGASIYDRKVYDFFNDEKNPLQLQKEIMNLAIRAYEKIQEEAQKDINAWVGRKSGFIERKLNKMKATLQEAEAVVGSASKKLEETKGKTQGTGTPSTSGGSGRPAFLDDIGARGKSVGNEKQAGGVADAKDKKIEELMGTIEELTAQVDSSVLELIKNEANRRRLKALIIKVENEEKNASIDISTSGGSTRFPILSFKSKTLTDLAVKANSSNGEALDQISSGNVFLEELNKKMNIGAAENKRDDLLFEIDEQMEKRYSVQEYVEECKDTIKKFEEAFDGITNSIDSFSNVEDAEKSINSLVKAMDDANGNITAVLAQAKSYSENVAKLDGETDDAFKERIKLKAEVYGMLLKEVENLQGDLKKIEDYKNKTLAVSKKQIVEMIKDYRAICKNAKNVIEAKERSFKSTSRNAFSNNVSAIGVAVSAIQDAMFEGAEFDEYLNALKVVSSYVELQKKDSNVKNSPEKREAVDKKNNLFDSINEKIKTLTNKITGNDGAKSKITLFNGNFAGKKYKEDDQGKKQKENDEKIKSKVNEVSEILTEMEKDVSSMVLVKNENSLEEKIKGRKETLNKLTSNIEKMTKILYSVDKQNEDGFESYKKSVKDEKQKIDDMKKNFSEFEKAGNAVVRISNQKYEEKKFEKVITDYDQALKSLISVPGFENVKPKNGSVPPPPPKNDGVK